MYTQNRNRLTDIENKFAVTNGGGEGQIRGTGLTDTNYYIYNRYETRIYYIA